MALGRRGPRNLPKEKNLEKEFKNANSIKHFTGGVSQTKKLRGNKGFVSLLEKKEKVDNSIKIISTLSRNGIYVPRVKYVDYQNSFIHFESGGITFHELINRQWVKYSGQRRKKILQLLPKIARVIGKIHRLEILPGHPHSGNIIIKGNKVGVIDFKSAGKKIVNWNSEEAIASAFNDDYFWLRRLFLSAVTLRSPKDKILHPTLKSFFSKIISQYPCTPELKRKLLLRIFALT